MLIDITDGPAGAAEGIRAAAGLLGCDLVVYADVGGDVLATGSEPGLASPLCDAVMLAAGARAWRRRSRTALIALVGAGCDGELTPDEVLGRIAALAARRRLDRQLERHRRRSPTSSSGPPPRSGTEASMQVVRCARGETRRGRDPRRAAHGAARARVGALTFFFDLEAAAAELPLAARSRAPASSRARGGR